MRNFVLALPIMMIGGCAALVIASTTATTLSSVASAACSAQKAANSLGTVAVAAGDTKAVQAASQASTVAGLLCTW